MKKVHLENTVPVALRAERRYQGVGLSDGIARAEVFTIFKGVTIPPKVRIEESDVDGELKSFHAALDVTRVDILRLKAQVDSAGHGREAGIFDAHLLILEDPTLIDEVERTVTERKVTSDWAFYEVARRYIEAMGEIEDSFLRERLVDIKDVSQRVLRHLIGRGDVVSHEEALRPHVLVANELTPSDTAAMDRDLVKGFIVQSGSTTSHAAIIARSLGLPAVMGITNAVEDINSGEEVLVDGYRGLVIVNPNEKTIEEYDLIIERHEEMLSCLRTEVGEPAQTSDGSTIVLSGNIEFKRELRVVMENGGAGVGLYRTEFFYLRDQTLPTELEQAQTYAEVAAEAGPHGVIIRTFDVGGDKLPDAPFDDPEPNPFLGWRGIRVSLSRRDVFKTQLRAILRASAHGKLRIMFPMIASVDEVISAKGVLQEAMVELTGEDCPYDENIEIGAMIEIPSAAIASDLIAPHVDFFSIGTNDLTQYTLAVDRVNERVAPLYRPMHPSVVRLIKLVVEAAHDNNIWVGVCGETAGDPLYTPLLVGMGVDELSVGPRQILSIRHAIRHLSYMECRKLVQRLVTAATTEQIEEDCRAMAQRCYPELLSLNGS